MGRKAGRFTVRPQFPPVAKCVFQVSKRTLYFFWEVVVWMLHIGRARHPGPGKRSFILGQLSIEFANIGGWLTYGDLAVDSCAQFLAVAEHRSIPARPGRLVISLGKLAFIRFGLLTVKILFLVVMLV